MQSTGLATVVCAGMIGAAQAQTDVPAGLHNTSEQWTLAGSPYRLKGQVYFTSGTTLTIDAGVIVASLPADGGSLAICRGAQIFVKGTQRDPVIMTSTNDVATWSGTTGSGSTQVPGNPKTGTWREAVNEWGNLTIMGAAYISENAIAANSHAPAANNVANMEGLVNGPTTDQYGGGNDDDDSGTITYLSVRYGGKVVALNNELNGLSLGGLGRGTDMHHLDIMNNIDDGIEIWGGTVNLKYVNIWNIGDDSFDIDQGWRGKAQFGLLVGGFSRDASTGSGVGDHAFETDGAEDSDYQPVTTTSIYNFTCINQPGQTRGTTAWRDNARVQYHNCIFMDGGGEVVKFDNVDGDGAHGYGFNGTLSWASTWTTAYNAVPPTANDPANPATFYQAQVSGNLAEMTDSVFFENFALNAYTEANLRNVFAAANNNVQAVVSPITAITRGPLVVKGGLNMLPVISLDPRPTNDALVSVGAAPNDGFFTPAQYRGAFEPGPTPIWLANWTASFAYGYTKPISPPSNYCTAGTTSNGCNATMTSIGAASATASSGFTLTATGVEGQRFGILFYGTNGRAATPWGGGSTSFLCVKSPTQRMGQLASGGTTNQCNGVLSVDWNAYVTANPNALGTPFVVGEVLDAQAWFRDPPAPKTTNLSDGLEFTVGP
jgi:hypothetical protein